MSMENICLLEQLRSVLNIRPNRRRNRRIIMGNFYGVSEVCPPEEEVFLDNTVLKKLDVGNNSLSFPTDKLMKVKD